MANFVVNILKSQKITSSFEHPTCELLPKQRGII